MTDEAFHEDWYQFKPSMQRTFLLLMMSNNLECKIAAIEKFNLSLPSFISVKYITAFVYMLQSYELLNFFKKSSCFNNVADHTTIIFDCSSVFKSELKMTIVTLLTFQIW